MDKLKPTVQEGVHEWLKHREKKTRQWYNRTSDRKYIAFKSGQNVVEKTGQDKFWKPRVILGKHKTPRSYLVQNYGGNVIRQTSKDLRPSYNHHAPVKNYSDFATVSANINMRVEGDRDSTATMVVETWTHLHKKFNHSSKHEPTVEMVQLIEANLNYANGQLTDGQESIVSQRHLDWVGINDFSKGEHAKTDAKELP
ncbi:hypothetical protein PR048_011428 [Dryococelus australis]|uniref:Uncharacterized protein n=1 Tax=Dryococelus australis TaxID=614101 RepID=A0ABQ9HLX9_9NEOP|nr:hypothetical protein PR048_011428 [Dryococelus australis]